MPEGSGCRLRAVLTAQNPPPTAKSSLEAKVPASSLLITVGDPAMADERARKLAESALNRLAAELQAGKSEALKNYLGTMGRFPVRYDSRHDRVAPASAGLSG